MTAIAAQPEFIPMSETLVPLCAAAEVAENTVKLVEVGRRALAVYNIGGTFYATDDECTHGAASLADGILDGDVIECTMHFGAFDVKTGQPVQEPCSIPLRTYKVVVRDGQVFADLEKSAGE
jgi:nitrite reductase/ring-hydroxylating ferredoxin subunit